MNPPCVVEGCSNPRRSAKPRGDGGFYCPPCRTRKWQQDNPEKFKAKVRARKQRLRVEIRAYLQNYKMQRGCTDCGYRKHSDALQFDHLSGKKFNLSSAGWAPYTMERIKEEISKCEVVCANCHAIRTANRREAAKVA